ncbi:MAG: cytochrome c3 family protein [Phycisphaerae bacterium]|mgnify:FL=1|jgi:menaquinone reductase, multiheme cytochrome c subunit|nr:cytochrome c3 family protein [Phycisphaerae bacterium]MBT5410019.1 cytochrome c3 family protein [Phycisphaerae bacterium]MBT6165398.1 cytochrome c3 family protein [Phycisphaerae bacterium]MBT7657750.1 cytochrome c3 family protein [Phycisphaerae bacterium]
MTQQRFTFPRWTNLALPAIVIAGSTAPLYFAIVVAYGFSPQAIDVGYMPEQPIPFSHKLHAGELGVDCRYCHNTVENTQHAAIPPTETCMNCHAQIHPQSENLQPLFESYETGMPIEWVRVHDLPQYTYFNHSAHVTRGVSCVECHGRVDTMEVVYQHETLSMGWCLDCHRNPVPHVRNPDLVTQLDWGLDMTAAERIADSESWLAINNLNPSQDCSTCHR